MKNIKGAGKARSSFKKVMSNNEYALEQLRDVIRGFSEDNGGSEVKGCESKGDAGSGNGSKTSSSNSGRSVCRYYVFTLNNFSSEEEKSIAESIRVPGGPSYVIYGREVGESGTPHLQGYIEFPRRVSISHITQLVGYGRAHLERRRGKQHQAIAYCKKDGDFVEFGTAVVSQQGRRSDLEAVADSIRNGAAVGELWREHTSAMIRYSRGILQARAYLNPVREMETYDLASFSFSLIFDMKKSHVVWGPAGCGKTSYCRARFPEALWVTHMDDLLGYDSQEVIIFDDMNFTHMPRTAQIHIVDVEQPRSIHCRYACARIPAGVTRVFTSNNKDIFADDAAIKRRVKYHQIHTIRSFLGLQ